MNHTSLMEVKYTYEAFHLEDAELIAGGFKQIYAVPAIIVGVFWQLR